MDVIDKIAKHLATWSKGGEAEWYVSPRVFRRVIHSLPSRNFLIAPHWNPTEPNDATTLNAAYQKLLFSTLKTWSPKPFLTPHALVNFIQSVLLSLPSSSAQRGRSANNTVYGELLVDIIWSTDAHLDELLADSKAILAASDQEPASQEPKGAAKATQAKQAAEYDKELLVSLVRRLLVSTVFSSRLTQLNMRHAISLRISSVLLFAESDLTSRSLLVLV